MAFRNRELDGYYTQESRKNTLKHRARNLTVKKLKRSVVGPAKTTSWTAVFNDLLLSSGSRLAPLLFAILDENQAMEDRLLSIAHPRSTDTGSQRGSMMSVKSGSSVSSSSVRVPSSDADVATPATDEEGTHYFKNLNSELNAKLQLFKQRGLAHITARTHDESQDGGSGSGGVGVGLQHHSSSRHTEDDSTTSRSDDIGSRDLPVNDSGCQPSLIPFLDEAPPPWQVGEVNGHLSAMRLMDEVEVEVGDGERHDDGSPHHDDIEEQQPVQKPPITQCSSAKTNRLVHSASMQKLMKTPSCHQTHSTFCFATSSVAPCMHRDGTASPAPLPLPSLSSQKYSANLNPFGDLDPLNSPELNMFNKP